VNCFHLDRPYPITPVATRRQFPVSGDRLSSEHPVLQVREISKHFKGTRGTRHLAVDRVSFDLRVGETLGLVGESGSGKTTVARIVLGLTPADSGNVLLEGEAWSEIREPDRRERRRVIQAIYQDPLSSFDPRFTVGRVMGEALGAADHPRGRARQDRVGELFDQVGLSSRLLNRYPVELSGGQRQRVAIARALASRPRIIICDEPVSALDVSVQAQVLDLLVDLQHELGVALLFISHDLGVVHHVSDRVAVMREGQILEIGSAEELFARPNHPYTAELVSATPRLPTQ
jgi:peptide/nickel transport system ATP-binding protein